MIKKLNYYKYKDIVYIDTYFVPKRDLRNEIKHMNVLKKYFDSNIYLVPLVKTNKIRTPDYYVEKTDEYWDLKIINGSSKNTIDNIFKQSKKQTSCLLLKMGNTKFNKDNIKDQIIYEFIDNRRPYIKQVILIDRKKRIIMHIIRK